MLQLRKRRKHVRLQHVHAVSHAEHTFGLQVCAIKPTGKMARHRHAMGRLKCIMHSECQLAHIISSLLVKMMTTIQTWRTTESRQKTRPRICAQPV